MRLDRLVTGKSVESNVAPLVGPKFPALGTLNHSGFGATKIRGRWLGV